VRYQDQANKHRKQALFKQGDLKWVHLRNERFPSKRKSQLIFRANGPFKVLEKVNNNAYKIDLLGKYGVSCTFNEVDLKPYYEDDLLENLRANYLQQEEDDVPIEDHAQELPKPKEIQEVPKIMRNQLGGQESFFRGRSSTCSIIMTSVA